MLGCTGLGKFWNVSYCVSMLFLNWSITTVCTPLVDHKSESLKVTIETMYHGILCLFTGKWFYFAFAVAGPRAWNNLPVDLRLSRHSLLSKHTWSHVCSTYPFLQFDCIIDCIIDYSCTEPLKPLVLHMPL